MTVIDRLVDGHASPPSATVAIVEPRDGVAASLARDRSLHLQAARLLLDALALGAAVALAFPLRFHWRVLETTPGPLPLVEHLTAAALWIVGVLGHMASHRLYDEDTLGEGGREMTRLRRSILEGVALVSAAVFLFRLVEVSRGWFLLVVVGSAILLTVERRATAGLIRRLRAKGRMRRPAILVSPGRAASGLDEGSSEFRVLETIRPDELSAALAARPDGRAARTTAVIIDGSFDRDELWRLMLQAGHAGSPVFLSSPFGALPADRLATRTLGERTIVKVAPPVITGVRAAEKRLLDVLVSAVSLLLLAIPMALIGLVIVATAGRPILYRQQRVGRDGRPFAMWKFRTMRVDAEDASGPVWATADDPRRTRPGAILRRLSLDELPQLWNVLRGDMSIVGPRPERPIFVARFNDGNPWYEFRHRIRPGITGLSQVRGHRGDTPLEPRIEADNFYIEHWSLTLDLRIAARTFLAVLLGRNAH